MSQETEVTKSNRTFALCIFSTIMVGEFMSDVQRILYFKLKSPPSR